MGPQRTTPEEVIGKKFRIGNHSATYQACFDAFSNSPFGSFQAGQEPRFHKKYAYDEETMLQDLGDEIHPVQHMQYIHDEIVAPLLSAQCDGNSVLIPSVTDVTVLRLAALFHNTGECEHPAIKQDLGVLAGSIPYSSTTQQDKSNEKMVRNYVLSRIGSPHNLMSQEYIDQIESTIDCKDESQFTDKTFFLCERLSYYTTAMRAAKIVLAEAPEGDSDHYDERLLQLSRLAVHVSAHRTILEPARSHYPYVDQALSQTKSTHSAVHTQIVPTLRPTALKI